MSPQVRFLYAYLITFQADLLKRLYINSNMWPKICRLGVFCWTLRTIIRKHLTPLWLYESLIGFFLSLKMLERRKCSSKKIIPNDPDFFSVELQITLQISNSSMPPCVWTKGEAWAQQSSLREEYRELKLVLTTELSIHIPYNTKWHLDTPSIYYTLKDRVQPHGKYYIETALIERWNVLARLCWLYQYCTLFLL